MPSNFVEKLAGDDLLDFHQAVVLGLRADLGDDEFSTAVPHELGFLPGTAPVSATNRAMMMSHGPPSDNGPEYYGKHFFHCA